MAKKINLKIKKVSSAVFYANYEKNSYKFQKQLKSGWKTIWNNGFLFKVFKTFEFFKIMITIIYSLGNIPSNILSYFIIFNQLLLRGTYWKILNTWLS